MDNDDYRDYEQEYLDNEWLREQLQEQKAAILKDVLVIANKHHSPASLIAELEELFTKEYYT